MRLAKKAVVDADYQALAEFRYHIRCYLEFSDQAALRSGIEPKSAKSNGARAKVKARDKS
jgi:hypothetical protein